MLAALRKFINQRSGIEWGNYGGSREAFMGDYRPMLKHGAQARKLLNEVERTAEISEKDLIDASRAYSGRLQFTETPEGVRVDYTTGQYFPTEYRNAACAVLSRALWDCWVKELASAVEVQRRARRYFGRAIAKTWFGA